jgi:hypothetical protein
MTAYEKAHKEYEALLRRDSVLIAFWSFCAGVLLAVVAMAVL